MMQRRLIRERQVSNGQATWGARRSILSRYRARFDDSELFRSAFGGLLLGALLVIGLDLKALYDERPRLDQAATGSTVYVEPVVTTSLRPSVPFRQPLDQQPEMAPSMDLLRQSLRFDLGPGGVLKAEGSIDPGAAHRFALELEARGEYVKTLSLNSPGGSLEDAMDMARLVRKRGIAVEVRDGAVCASSCPLLLAGGIVRSVGDTARIGLHQFYAPAGRDATNPAQAISDTQATAARISRYLAEMGVDPALWLHALDTPPQKLYYLSREEMTRYKLVTTGTKVASR